MLFKAKELRDYRLHCLDGEIGRVREFYFDDRHWAVRYLVADTGDWLPGRQVLISPYAMGLAAKGDHSISVSLTKKQIEDSPALESAKPVSRQFEEAYYGHYGWPTYWAGPFMWGTSAVAEVKKAGELPKLDPSDVKHDYHLRSTGSVTGHRVHATDGDIGHIEDFIIEDRTWAIRYLVVDTSNWWQGKKVLIAPRWIDRISWEQSKVFVGLTRDAVKRSPEYSQDALLSRDYEAKLHRHYDRWGYWAD